MTARELDKLIRKYNIGYCKLTKDYADDGDDSLFLKVYNNDNEIITDKIHFEQIQINDSTFGYDWEGEITDEAYDFYEINEIQFFVNAWAYPTSYIDEPDGGLDVAEANCGIRLTDYKKFDNAESEVDAYTEQAIKAFLNPLEYQNWLLRMYLDEQTKFIEKHWQLLKSMGYSFKETGIFKRGFTTEYESEIYTVFTTTTKVSDLYVRQNMFTGRWTIHEQIQKEDGEFIHLVYNINDMSSKELSDFVLRIFERNGEEFWREEKEFRLKYFKEHNLENCPDEFNPYSIDIFLKEKCEMTQQELLEKYERERTINEG